MYASQEGHVKVVDTLLQHGARVNLKTNVSPYILPPSLPTYCLLHLMLLQPKIGRIIIIILVYVAFKVQAFSCCSIES